jgi:uncharacterized protein (TIGR02145 family)
MGSNSEITLLNTSLTQGVSIQSGGSLTSSQYSSTQQIHRNFNGGNHPGSKNDAWHIRAIRSFSLDSNTSTPIVDSLRSMRISYFAADFKFNLVSNGNLTTGIGLCYAAHPNPTILDSTEFVESTLYGEKVLTAIDLNPNTDYYVRGYAINKDGITYTHILHFRTKAIDTIVQDIDGNNYRVITVGNHQWFIDELRTKRFTNGDSIPRVIPNSTWSAMNQPAYSILDNNSLNEDKFGLLYNGYTVTGQRRICPTGWRVPNNTDIFDLISHMSSEGLNNSRNHFMTHKSWHPWTSMWPELYQTNNVGWSAMATGTRYIDGNFRDHETYTYYWLNTFENNNPHPQHVRLDWGPAFSSSFQGWHPHESRHGFSVRCTRNQTIGLGQLPIIQTELPTSVFASGAVVGGNVVSDGGSNVIDRGICYDTLPYPSITGNLVFSGSGVGTFTTTISGLNSNRNYYVRAFATNLIGTAYGQQHQFITPNPVAIAQPCNPPTVTDIDGNVYNTVQIGTQCWMKENMRTTRLNDGDTILHKPLQNQWQGVINEPSWCHYGNNPSSEVFFGKLYNWYAAVGDLKICPIGWRTPTDADMSDLYYFASLITPDIASALMDSISWGNPGRISNSTGWSARFIGNRGENGDFYNKVWGNSGPFTQNYWINGFDPWGTPHVRRFTSESGNPVGSDGWREGRRFGAAVRCIKN